MGRRMGRPPLPKGDAKDVVFTLRMSVAERDELATVAKRAGQPVTQWARSVLVASARKLQSSCQDKLLDG